MLGLARGRWTQGMKGEAVWPLAGGEEEAKGLPGALLSTQEPPPAPSPASGCTMAQSPLCPTYPHAWIGLSSVKERGRGRGKGRERAPSQPSTLGQDWDDVGGEAAPTARGRQEKASKEALDPARPGTGHTGPLCSPGHACAGTRWGKSRAAVSVPVTHLEEAPAPSSWRRKGGR